MGGRRLSRASRRQQLLETALVLIREDGTASLTLARLAARAGVTKPVAYQHFGTRAGLLKTLYAEFDARQAAVVRDALANGVTTLADAAEILAGSYVDCALAAGPEFVAITAALVASGDIAEIRASARDAYLALIGEALSAIGHVPRPHDRALLVGLLGAADSLSGAVIDGHLSRAAAVAALATLSRAAFAPDQEGEAAANA